MLEDLPLRNWDIEYELIMYLEYHLPLQSFIMNLDIELHHRNLDNISRCPLYWHIHGLSFCDTPHRPIRIIDPWDISMSSEIRLDIAIRPRILEEGIIVGANSRIANIECINIFLGLRYTTVEGLCQSESRDPIYHSEVDTLGNPPFMARYFFVFAKEESRRPHMDILSILERIEESGILGKKSEHTDLYL